MAGPLGRFGGRRFRVVRRSAPGIPSGAWASLDGDRFAGLASRMILPVAPGAG
jgi:hypothetical protein